MKTFTHPTITELGSVQGLTLKNAQGQSFDQTFTATPGQPLPPGFPNVLS